MAVDGTVKYKVDYDTAEAKKDLKSFKTTLKDVGKSASNVGDGITKYFGAPLVAAAGAGLTALYALGQELDEVKKTAIGVGAGVEGFQALQYAGELAGVETTKMGDMLKKIQESLGNNADEWKNLGIHINNADGSLRSTDEILPDLLEKLSTMEGQEKLTAIQALGLNENIGDLNKLLDVDANFAGNYADGLEKAVSSETISEYEAFNDSLTEIKTSFTNSAAAIGTKFLPRLQELADWLAGDGGEQISSFMESSVEWAEDWGGLALGVAGVGAVLSVVGRIISGLSSIITAGTTAVGGMSTAIGAVGGAGVATGLVGAVIAVHLAMDDLIAIVGDLYDQFTIGPRMFEAWRKGGVTAFEGLAISAATIADSILNIFIDLSNGVVSILNGILAFHNSIAPENLKIDYTIPKADRVDFSGGVNSAITLSRGNAMATQGSSEMQRYGGGVNINTIEINATSEIADDKLGEFSNEVMNEVFNELQTRGAVE